MAATKYRQKYCKEIVNYFKRFIDMRDDPKEADMAERRGMVAIDLTDTPKVLSPPCTGYPTLTKFAIKIGVSPRTLSNWRTEFPEFDEACDFAEEILSDVLDERALFEEWDSKTAMKIRELRQAAKLKGSGTLSGAKVVFEIKSDPEDKPIEVKTWEGEVNEDTNY